MFDELERLRDSQALHTLLEHYAELGKEDPDQWQDRFKKWEGLEGRKLSDLYGELIAHGWLEQNTGATPILERDRFAACYRITSGGRKALKQTKESRQDLLPIEAN
ncbi:MAG: hypothetical protein ACFCD0_16490 [Gemmataceae bacterium]